MNETTDLEHQFWADLHDNTLRAHPTRRPPRHSTHHNPDRGPLITTTITVIALWALFLGPWYTP